MQRVSLVHCTVLETEGRRDQSSNAGYAVASPVVNYGTNPRGLIQIQSRELGMDLARLALDEHDQALKLQQRKNARHVHQAFVAMGHKGLACIQASPTHAVYHDCSRIRSCLDSTIAHTPTNSFVSPSNCYGYKFSTPTRK